MIATTETASERAARRAREERLYRDTRALAGWLDEHPIGTPVAQPTLAVADATPTHYRASRKLTVAESRDLNLALHLLNQYTLGVTLEGVTVTMQAHTTTVQWTEGSYQFRVTLLTKNYSLLSRSAVPA